MRYNWIGKTFNYIFTNAAFNVTKGKDCKS